MQKKGGGMNGNIWRYAKERRNNKGCFLKNGPAIVGPPARHASLEGKTSASLMQMILFWALVSGGWERRFASCNEGRNTD